MYLGFILWLIFIFFLCCGASGCIGFILLVWTLGGNYYCYLMQEKNS